MPVVPAGGDAASARANVTAPALRILDEQGLAQLGFAAGRSEVGLEQYEIHEWWFKRNVDGFHGEERLSRTGTRRWCSPAVALVQPRAAMITAAEEAVTSYTSTYGTRMGMRIP